MALPGYWSVRIGEVSQAFQKARSGWQNTTHENERIIVFHEHHWSHFTVSCPSSSVSFFASSHSTFPSPCASSYSCRSSSSSTKSSFSSPSLCSPTSSFPLSYLSHYSTAPTFPSPSNFPSSPTSSYSSSDDLLKNHILMKPSLLPLLLTAGGL
jgi:hypothetical protein